MADRVAIMGEGTVMALLGDGSDSAERWTVELAPHRADEDAVQGYFLHLVRGVGMSQELYVWSDGRGLVANPSGPPTNGLRLVLMDLRHRPALPAFDALMGMIEAGRSVAVVVAGTESRPPDAIRSLEALLANRALAWVSFGGDPPPLSELLSELADFLTGEWA
jgi:hypothetical protein